MTPSTAGKYVGIIALSLSVLSVLYIGAFVYQLGALVPAEYWIYETQIVKRELLAEHRDKRKILFVAGSSTFFGIDAGRIEQALGTDTLNLGVSIARPFAVMVNDIMPYVQTGDVVIFPLEYELYHAETTYTDWFTNQVMAWDPDYFWELHATEKVRFMRSVLPQRVLLGAITKAVGSHFESVQARQLKPPDHIRSLIRAAWSQPNYRPSKMYSFLNNDRHGNAIIRTPEPVVVSTGDPYELDIDFIDSPYFWSTLQGFVEHCRAKGVSVYIAWPPVVSEKLNFRSSRVTQGVSEIMGRLREMGISVLGNPSDFQYDIGHFTDKLYHLTLQGRAEHTARLLAHLMNEPRLFLTKKHTSATKTSFYGTARPASCVAPMRLCHRTLSPIVNRL